jgi:hypothetical protein
MSAAHASAAMWFAWQLPVLSVTDASCHTPHRIPNLPHMLKRLLKNSAVKEFSRLAAAIT